jgi:hypothetical protein
MDGVILVSWVFWIESLKVFLSPQTKPWFGMKIPKFTMDSQDCFSFTLKPEKSSFVEIDKESKDDQFDALGYSFKQSPRECTYCLVKFITELSSDNWLLVPKGLTSHAEFPSKQWDDKIKHNKYVLDYENPSCDYFAIALDYPVIPERSTASGPGLEEAKVNSNNTFAVRLVDQFGNLKNDLFEVDLTIRITLFSEDGSTSDISSAVSIRDDFVREVDYMPTDNGLVNIEVSVSDVQILASPFSVVSIM